MAWTTPKTFAALDVLTAAELNTHVRDNLDYLYDRGPWRHLFADGAINDTLSPSTTEQYNLYSGAGIAVPVDGFVISRGWVKVETSTNGVQDFTVNPVSPMAGESTSERADSGTGIARWTTPFIYYSGALTAGATFSPKVQVNCGNGAPDLIVLGLSVVHELSSAVSTW